MSLSDNIIQLKGSSWKGLDEKEYKDTRIILVENLQEAVKELKKRMRTHKPFEWSTGELLIIQKLLIDVDEIFGEKLI